MAKVVRTEKLVASNKSEVVFLDGSTGPCFTTENMFWPLDEFEDLVKFVRAHIAEQAAKGESKLSEVEVTLEECESTLVNADDGVVVNDSAVQNDG